MSGYTDIFVLKVADFKVLTNGTQIILCPLAVGDIIREVFIDVRTAIVGPTGTPTISVGNTATATQFTNTVSLVTAPSTTLNNSGAPAAVAAATNLIVDFEAGGGNGAAATAGEVWIFANIKRWADRNTQKG